MTTRISVNPYTVILSTAKDHPAASVESAPDPLTPPPPLLRPRPRPHARFHLGHVRVGVLCPTDVVRNVGDDDAGAEEQSGFEQERRLIVQQVLPPARGNELRKHDQEC